jgi:hypothetical protein
LKNRLQTSSYYIRGLGQITGLAATDRLDLSWNY